MHRETLTARSVDTTRAVGVLGATSFLGRRLLERLQAPDPPGAETSAAGRRLFAFTRAAAATPDASGRVRWRRFPIDHATWRETIPHWVAVCPLWAVPEHFPLLEASGARRLVALSSTSRFTKRESTDAAERSLAARLAAAEDEVIAAARARGIVATIFRPTMIYDGSHDRNVTAIAAFIRRYRFFPVVGAAAGLRQPVHADDVVAACETALARDGETDAYELSGGEILSYREMVQIGRAHV